LGAAVIDMLSIFFVCKNHLYFLKRGFIKKKSLGILGKDLSLKEGGEKYGE
jgi:hypothetical protein